MSGTNAASGTGGSTSGTGTGTGTGTSPGANSAGGGGAEVVPTRVLVERVAADPLVQQAVELFAGRIVHVQPKPEAPNTATGGPA